ncbi:MULTISPECIES: type IV secretion system protein [unclassified Novosphingobium]|uniref:virB8 family protein n=1 Tax=unclassified Novosphingobium TaxID=2644732 RepID=UPI00146A2E63|nr:MULTISPECIES: type IV secretion system protein [unclassified Novosphingobium]NMN07544.1 type IV secretion system protein VirB8 [Novosphingobium sp. SG919]NMN89853.1 type IV secretion system protein VirB8 [Novosphingobium sp. SG916]
MAEGVRPGGDLRKYFEEARSWDFDRAKAAHASKRRAYGMAVAGVAVAALALAWHVASPLRSVEPYVIRVDRSSGGVDVMTKVSNSKEITSDEAVNKYFIAEYVRSRESWLRPGADDLFRKVVSLSVPQEQEKFAAERRPENPQAPINVYAGGEVISTTIRNISFINSRVAQVRFSRVTRRPGNAPDQSQDFIATINFKYLDKPANEADRLYNPLGFQVVSYRADPEIAR